MFLESSRWESIRKRAVSSTNTSPIRFMDFFVGVIIWKQSYFSETEDSMGSSTRVHMHGETPDP